jgi:hypothetical protein
MDLVRLTKVNRDHSRLHFRNTAGKEHSVVLPDHCLSHPLTCSRALHEKGIRYRPPNGVVDHHSWSALLERVKAHAQFCDDASPCDGPAYRAVVSKVYGDVKALLDAGTADPSAIRAALQDGVAAIDAMRNPTPART